MDFYGGWKTTWGDRVLDLGAIYYYYPGTDANRTANTQFTNPRNGKVKTGSVHNSEIYFGGFWKCLSLKYNNAVSDYFSLPGTKNSGYLDLSGTYDLGDGWGIVGHVGSFRLKNWNNGVRGNNANYTDWKLGVTKHLGGWIFDASYIDTSAKGSCNLVGGATEFYCFANQLPNTGIGTGSAKFKNMSNSTVVLSASKIL